MLRLNDRLSLTAYGDVGGFGVGSDFTWQTFATLDYKVAENATISAGFRYIHIDYQKGRTDISLEMAGPIIGASIRF